MISNRPSIPKNQETDDTFPAMSELVPMRSFDDSALLNSLTHFCIGFLTQYQNHREMIMAYPEVHTRIKLLLAEPARDIDWHFRDPNMLDYDAIFNAIVSSGDNTLVERILFSGTKYREQFLSAVATDTLEDLYKKLRTCIRTTGTILPLGNLSETVQYVTFEQLDMRSLLSPCEAEEICLRWLLGSDRIQLSGQEKLLLEDVEVTPTHVTIHYLKIRSGQEERTSTSHRKKTWQYSILEYYTDLRKNFDEQFPKETLRPGKLFQYTNPFARRQNLASISYRPLILACSPKTQMYQDIAAANPEANYFQDYYLSLIRENTKSYELAKQRKKNNTVGEVYADGHTNASLTANVVAQSRAIIDPDTPPTTSPFDRFLRQSVSADATAHTPWTKEFIYKIRSTTVHRLDKRANFADSVGALQESEARKLTFLMEKTEIININDINDILGLHLNFFKDNDIEDFNRLIEQAENAGYACSPFGALTSPEKKERIIVATPVTVALILSYIDACEVELNRADIEARRTSMIVQIAYAKMILAKFDHRTLAEGIEIKETHDFPMPYV